MIVGLVKPTSGKITLDGKEITNDAMYKRAQKGIGYLAQEASVFRKLSVEDNILGVLQLTNKSKQEQIRRTNELIEEFSLEHVRKNRGDLLSGGERRRTEIARCLATDPDFILLDEPFAGVDPIAVEDIQKIIGSLEEDNCELFSIINRKIIHEINEGIKEKQLRTGNHFFSFDDLEINEKVADTYIEQYQVSKWDKHNIYFPLEDELIKTIVEDTILRYKRQYCIKTVNDIKKNTKITDEDYAEKIKKITLLRELKIKIDNKQHRIL
jgi:ABC-type multidrug transport system ATPase subunit